VCVVAFLKPPLTDEKLGSCCEQFGTVRSSLEYTAILSTTSVPPHREVFALRIVEIEVAESSFWLCLD
jgi:hypothetical protein